MAGSIWRCGLSLSMATKVVGVGNVGISIICISILTGHSKIGLGALQRQATVTPVILVSIAVAAFGIQLLMGAVLFYGAVKVKAYDYLLSNKKGKKGHIRGLKSRTIVGSWLVVFGLTSFFTGLILRLYEMLVVMGYYHELEKEEEFRNGKYKSKAVRKRRVVAPKDNHNQDQVAPQQKQAGLLSRPLHPSHDGEMDKDKSDDKRVPTYGTTATTPKDVAALPATSPRI